MDKYTRVPRTYGNDTEANEVRIGGVHSQVSASIEYGLNLFDNKEKPHDSIIVKAIGGKMISKAIFTAEIIKLRVPGLHQITEIGTTEIITQYLPKEEGLDKVEISKKSAYIKITLSKTPLDTTNPGYQAPLPESEVQKRPIRPREYISNRGGRGGFRGGRGVFRGGRGSNRGGRGGFRGGNTTITTTDGNTTTATTSPTTTTTTNTTGDSTAPTTTTTEGGYRSNGYRGRSRGRGRGRGRGGFKRGRGGFRSEGYSTSAADSNTTDNSITSPTTTTTSTTEGGNNDKPTFNSERGSFRGRSRGGFRGGRGRGRGGFRGGRGGSHSSSPTTATSTNSPIAK